MTPVLWVDVSKFKSRRGKLTSYFSPAIELCQSQLSTSLFIRLISQEFSYLDKYIGEFFNNCGNETASLLYQHFKAIRTLIVFKLGSSSRQTTVDKFSIFRLQAFKILLVQRIFLILLVERSARAILFSHWQSLPLTKLLFKVLGVLSALYVFGDSRLLATIRLTALKYWHWALIDTGLSVYPSLGRSIARLIVGLFDSWDRLPGLLMTRGGGRGWGAVARTRTQSVCWLWLPGEFSWQQWRSILFLV